MPKNFIGIIHDLTISDFTLGRIWQGAMLLNHVYDLCTLNHCKSIKLSKRENITICAKAVARAMKQCATEPGRGHRIIPRAMFALLLTKKTIANSPTITGRLLRCIMLNGGNFSCDNSDVAEYIEKTAAKLRGLKNNVSTMREECLRENEKRDARRAANVIAVRKFRKKQRKEARRKKQLHNTQPIKEIDYMSIVEKLDALYMRHGIAERASGSLNKKCKAVKDALNKSITANEIVEGLTFYVETKIHNNEKQYIMNYIKWLKNEAWKTPPTRNAEYSHNTDCGAMIA